MISKDFYGKNGTIWFTGLVAQVSDKAKLGQVRVRIVGIHSLDESLCPTETLPLAQVAVPTTGAHSTSGPIPGDWVYGFFQDGDFGQMPTITGIFPGVESPQSREMYKKVAEIEAKQGNLPDRKPAYDYRQDGADKDPVIVKNEVETFGYFPRASQVFRELEDATSFRSARGVYEGTLTAINNGRLAEACDISEEVKTAIAWARMQNNILIKTLTTALKALVTSVALSDFSGLISIALYYIKLINRWINWIRDIIQFVRDWLQVINYVVNKIKEIIAFILNLPERLLQLLRKCLAYFLGGIANFITGVISSALVDFDLDDLANALINLDTSIRGLVGDAGGFIIDLDGTITNIGTIPEQAGKDSFFPNNIIEDLINPTTLQARAESTNALIDFTKIQNDKLEVNLNKDMYYNKIKTYDDVQYVVRWQTP